MPQLSSLAVNRISTPGRHSDTNGLILQVTRNRSGEVRKSWLVRYQLNGKRREMGIGTYPDITLSVARDIALDAKRQAKDGIDPILSRNRERRMIAQDNAASLTFKECAKKYIASHEASWSNPKHRQQWHTTLETYAFPYIGSMDVNDIELNDIMDVLEPIWSIKTETASRVRGRMEKILGWAIVRGHRKGSNPAIWKANLEMLLPMRSRIQSVKHHAALEFEDVPEFMEALRARIGPSAQALEFIILTAARSGEVRYAPWAEIDWDDRLWIIPAKRMKMSREHRVPLSDAALRLLKKRWALFDKPPKPSDHIFFNTDPTRPFSDAVFRQLFARMKYTDITAHGFRSSFRDWAGDATEFPRELAELALAHNVGDETERAYRRNAAVERRRKLMQDWADFCAGPVNTALEGNS